MSHTSLPVNKKAESSAVAWWAVVGRREGARDVAT